MTNQLGFVDFVIQKLMNLTSEDAKPTPYSECVQTLQEEFVSLRVFLGNIVKLRHQQEELQTLWDRVLEMAYRAEELIDLFLVVGDVPDSFSSSFDSIMKDFANIKPAIEIKTHEIKVNEATIASSSHVATHTTPITTTTEIVGFADEANSIIDQLTRGTKQLRMTAIVGMPGLGKTTLASKIFNDSSIVHYFHVQAWSTVSQVVDKEKVFRELLNQIDPDIKCSQLTGQDLIQKLWRKLKGRRYLIVLDDIWDVEAWNSLRESLPYDITQSRILLTSRRHCVAPREMLLDHEPHFLRQLNVKEGLKLLQIKLFSGDHGWPPALLELGMQSAEICKGLPLTIVIVAGLLATTKSEGWKEILIDLSSGELSITEQCMKTLERSYEHLPDDLRPCLLYFGAFPEDLEFSARRLLYLWIAEGFIGKAEGKDIEDVAEGYLKDLVGRSLVMVGRKRWDDGVKACRIHDLLHDFCLRKAKDEHFFHALKGYDELSTFNEPSNLRRLSIHSKTKHFEQSRLFSPKARTLLFHTSRNPKPPHLSLDISPVINIFKRLRVLDLGTLYVKN